eukprot:4951174-Pyramimonas_sp.AAC.1
MELDGRYAIKVEVQLQEDYDGSLGARASVAIDVDLPQPFSSVPKKQMTTLASGILQNMVSLFLISVKGKEEVIFPALSGGWSVGDPTLGAWDCAPPQAIMY